MNNQEFKLIKKIEKINWWHKSREEFINFFIRKSNIDKNKLILNIGCGTNSIINKLKDFNIYGLDNNIDITYYSNKNIIISEATKLPFKNSSIQTIFMFDLLEHIKKDYVLIKELNRVLIKNGSIFLSVPAFNFLWGLDDVLAKHYRRYNKKDLKNKFSLHFYFSGIYYWNFFLFFPLVILKLFHRLKMNFTKTPESTYFDQIYSRYFSEKDTIINKIMYNLIKFENFMLKNIKFPLGISIFCHVKKLR